MESDKASPEMIVQVDTKSAFEGYDFPNEPPKPAIPPRAPRPGTLNKRSYLWRYDDTSLLIFKHIYSNVINIKVNFWPFSK